MTKASGQDRPGNASRPGGDRDEEHDPGAYIGREPEFESETIPGGVGPKDERVSAVATQPGGKGEVTWGRDGDTPEGHRVGTRVDDDEVRRAG